eukprot:gene34954-43103_t
MARLLEASANIYQKNFMKVAFWNGIGMVWGNLNSRTVTASLGILKKVRVPEK